MKWSFLHNQTRTRISIAIHWWVEHMIWYEHFSTTRVFRQDKTENKQIFGKLPQIGYIWIPGYSFQCCYHWLTCTIDQHCPADDIGEKIILMQHSPTLQLPKKHFALPIMPVKYCWYSSTLSLSLSSHISTPHSWNCTDTFM